MWPFKIAPKARSKIGEKEFILLVSPDLWYCEKFTSDVTASVNMTVLDVRMAEKLLEKAQKMAQEHSENNINSLMKATGYNSGFQLSSIDVSEENGKRLIGLDYTNETFGGDMGWDFIYDEDGAFIEIQAGD